MIGGPRKPAPVLSRQLGNSAKRILIRNSVHGIEKPSIGLPQSLQNQTASTDHPPALTLVEINDPIAAGETIEILHQDVVLLQSKPLRARRVIVHAGPSVIVYQSTNFPVRARTRILHDRVAFLAFGPREKGAFNGVPVGPDLLLPASPGAHGGFVVQAGYESIYVTVHATKAVSMIDLCEATGVSERSLEALCWGFCHFGDFSRAYKNRFGQLPSDTLERAPG